MANEKIIVTGAAGFIGSNLSKVLLKQNYEVGGIDNLSQSTTANIEEILDHPQFHFVVEDVRNVEEIQEIARGASKIIHLAAYKIPRYGNALDTLTINIHGTRSVLAVASKEKTHVVFASTSDVYGKNPYLPFSEQHDHYLGETNIRRWAYASSKLLDEHYCFAYQQEQDVPITILRFFGGYGPGQNRTWWGGPQSVFIDAAIHDKPMEIHGDGMQTRSFTYIEDTVDGIIRATFNPRAIGEVFNIGNTVEITILDLAHLVWKLAGSGEPKIHFKSYQAFGKYDDVRNRVPDILKARTILGFEAKTNLEEGLKRTIEWQRKVTQIEKG
jgi:UDP-glucose 4-epimerase